MDFESFKTWRHGIVAERAPLRFDCLNPFAAMAWARRWDDGTGAEDPSRALAVWARVHGMDHRPDRHLVATQGVRSALGGLFEAAGVRGMDIVLPRDVYPFYAQEAARRAPTARVLGFSSLEGVALGEAGRAGAGALLVAPQPMNAAGRFLAPSEREALGAWARGGANRWVVLDAVYLYSTRLDPALWAGLPAERTIVLTSMSKSWLLRGVFGAALGPVGGDAWWSEALEGPTPEASGHALAALEQDPGMPLRQRRAFAGEWARRFHAFGDAARGQAGPGEGYFRPIKEDARRLLEERNILAVPATVFGHPTMEWSVATCLFESGSTNGF